MGNNICSCDQAASEATAQPIMMPR